jgi:hypothetical protein
VSPEAEKRMPSLMTSMVTLNGAFSLRNN